MVRNISRNISRTMVRYAIEIFDNKKRAFWSIIDDYPVPVGFGICNCAQLK